MKLSNILGLNARTQIYSYGHNSNVGKKIARSKLLTKSTLKKADIPVPEIYAKFKMPEDVLRFDWSKLPASFALKPNKGLGGEGIIVVKKRAKDTKEPENMAKLVWVTTARKKITVEDLRLHVLDVLEGAFSVGNVPDIAYIEEFVGRHKAFSKYAFRGTPDIRIIVFNKIPVMAMLRLPTRESGGRANLHQGAIAVGIDIATGITTRAYWHGAFIHYKPGTKRKLHGIKIPQWTTCLETAVRAQVASGLGYVGVDLVLHPDKGPMVLEINSQPGLQIQMANFAGLRKRLERVEDLEVRDVEHGVNIGKSLFASSFANRVRRIEDPIVVGVVEEIKIRKKKGERLKIQAKIDTGAWRTSIDKNLADGLGLLVPSNVIKTKTVRSSLGREERPIITLTYWMRGVRITTMAGVAKRHNMKYLIIIGRRDLSRFLVKPVIYEYKK